MGCRLSGPWTSDGTMGVSAQDLRYIRNHEALRILTSYKQPITMQIEGRRGRGLHYHRPSDSSTQTERAWDNVTSDRACYSHMTLPGNHGDGRRYEYLPNTARDLEDTHKVPRHDPEFSPKAARKQNCLLSCCNSNMEEPSSFQSQTEDEDYVLEKTLGYLPLHHELDSGLGWTDGSFHQGELSGVETEEGLEECHTHQGGRGARVRGGSPSSESFVSSELSDSGFYSVSTAEFLRFQRLLEKRMRIYNSRLHHQGELQNLCIDAQKAHRELEAIPEALVTQQDSECVEADPHTPPMVRVASMQLRKNERPCLNRHSSSSAAIFSTCSSPSGQQRATAPHGSTAAGMLRRSRTLHHRPVHVEQRRRASHPASPNYCSVTLNRYTHALQQQLSEETEAGTPRYSTNYRTHHANHLTHHANHLSHHANHLTHHANHIIHHANHPTYHASYPTHQANHLSQNAHLANYTTLHASPASSMAHANYPTHIANQAANNFTHSSQHPYHATLPAQHTHHAHTTLTAHAPHAGHAHATLPIQHTHHHANATHPAHSTYHAQAPVTPPTQHTHHAHAPVTPPTQHTYHAHAPVTPPTQHTHHAHAPVTPPTQQTYHAHAPVTPPTQHTHHAHAPVTPPTQHIYHAHTPVTPPTQHTHHAHVPVTPATQHTHHVHVPVTPPTQQTHHAHAPVTPPTQHTHHAHIPVTPLTQQTHHAHAPMTPPTQQTHHAHSPVTPPSLHTHRGHGLAHAARPGHAHNTPTAYAAHPGHTHSPSAAHPGHAHTHTTINAQDHSHNKLSSHGHATLPAQNAHHTSRTRPKHAISQPSLSSSTDDHHFGPPPESHCHDNRGRSFTEPTTGGREECGKETLSGRDRGRFHTLSHTPSQEGNDTWPKTTNRHGPYGTLEGHVTTAMSPAEKPPSGSPNPRAVRNQLLRERALRLADERGGGISTDDEANVEIRRVGRYWSRSERREQVLQKQRQKKEALRGGGANSSSSVGGDSGGYSILMELSQRKLSRLRNRKLLDDWTTVEELLTHGTRLGTHDENVQIPNSLLTVTTV